MDQTPPSDHRGRTQKPTAFVLDGEAVVLDGNGLADFDRLMSRKYDAEVKLLAFDLLAVDGVDVRPAPLRERQARLAKSGEAIALVEHLTGEIGPTMFEHACKLGAEGIISKRIDRAYRAGRCSHWLKSKNPDAPAMKRVWDDTW